MSDLSLVKWTQFDRMPAAPNNGFRVLGQRFDTLNSAANVANLTHHNIMSSRRQLWLVRLRFVALLAAMMVAIGWSTKTRADSVLVTEYSFLASGTVDLINPATGLDTGAYISGVSSPSGIAIGTDGSIYVAEQGTSPGVGHYSASGMYLGTIATATADTANDAPLSVGGVRVGANGNVYATDYGSGSRSENDLSNTELFQYSGVTGSFVNSAVSTVPMDSAATGLAFDNASNIYIADFSGGRVVKYNSATQTQTTIISTSAGSTGPSNSPLAGPSGLLLLPNGNLLVGDLLNENILEYTTSGTYLAPFELRSNQSVVSYPSGLQLTPNGQDILVANLGQSRFPANGSVAEFDLNGNLLNNWATGLASDVAVLASPTVTWNSAASSGMYSSGTNWTTSGGAASAPNGAGTNATFGAGGGGTVTINGQFIVGTLAFDSTNEYILQSGSSPSSITFNNNGLGGLVTVPGSQTHAINTNLILSDIGSTGFNIGSGGELDIGGPINGSGALALTGGGNLVIGSGGSIGNQGGTTIENGQLKIGSSGSIGGQVTLMVAYGNNGELDLAAPATSLSSLTSSTDSVAGTTATVNVATNSTLAAPALSVTGTLNFNSAASNNGSIAISGAPTLAAGSQLNVHAGTLSFNVTNGSTASIGSGVSVVVATGATLQLAGAVSALSDGSAIVPSSGNLATVANSGTLQVTGANQSVGVVAGNVTTIVVSDVGAEGQPTTYEGNAVVGDGMTPASLTATQILQNTLTINAGSTVTIAPSGPGMAPMDNSANAAIGVASNAAAESMGSGNDPFAAIEAALTSGGNTAQRITLLRQLTAAEPELHLSLIDDRELALDYRSTTGAVSFAFSSDEMAPASLIDTLANDGLADSEIGSLLGVNSGSISSLAGGAAFASMEAGSPTAVPEPSTLMLAALAVVGLAVTIRARIGRHVCSF